MEADGAGLQRKVVTSRVRPARRTDGSSGIALRDGRALPFVVGRAWSAPAGVYIEQWYLVDPGTREVLYESRERQAAIWGLQALTELSDEVRDSVGLRPGTYLVVFALSRVVGGELEVEAFEAPVEEAA
jgi:hypothetical protein